MCIRDRCFIGAYSLNNSVFEVGVMAFFGVLGYILKKLDFPGLPAILGLILGSSAETSLRQGLIMSDNDWSIYFTRPLSLVFMLITFAMLFLPRSVPCGTSGRIGPRKEVEQ